MKKNLLLLVVAFLCALPMSAKKKFYTDQITMSDIYVWQQGNALTASMLIDMAALKIEHDQALILVPTLTDGTNVLEFPGIIVNGKKKQKEFLKAVKKTGETINAVVMEYEKRDAFVYSQVINYQPWMANASLYLGETLIGKKDRPLMASQELITNVVSTEAKRLAELIPVVAFIEPVEVEKVMDDVFNAYLDFKLNQATILPKYKNNAQVLGDMQTMFDNMVKNTNITINKITIEGYASPEGPEGFNEGLAKRRTEALMKYFANDGKIPATTFQTAFGGENWEGLVIALDESTLPYKDSIIWIINNTPDDKARKAAIKAYDGGAPYKDMLKNIYPALRNVAIKINFTVKTFTTEEAMVVMTENPNLLSEREYYNVAFQSPRGSKKFLDVFEVAQSQYPNDPVSNLNAAGAYLTTKNVARAEKAMAKADKKTGEYLNNLGIISFYKGNVQGAINYFKQAAQLNNQAAVKNLSMIMNAINAHQ